MQDGFPGCGDGLRTAQRDSRLSTPATARWPTSSRWAPRAADPLRVIVIVAVKNDLALVAAAEGPFREFTPSFGPGPPSPANLQIAQDMGKYVNSFSWRGDPPR